MVKKIEENELQKARAVVEAFEKRQRKGWKKMAFEAVKQARKWLFEGRLKPMYVVMPGKAGYYKRDPNVVPKGGPE